MLLETTVLDIVTTVMIVFQVLVCLLLILVVMMQRPKQEGLGAAFGGDTMDSIAGAGTTDILQKGTALLGTILFVLTFAVSMLVIAGASNENKTSTNDSELAPATSADPADEDKIASGLEEVEDEITSEETTSEEPVEPETSEEVSETTEQDTPAEEEATSTEVVEPVQEEPALEVQETPSGE